MILFLDFDGVLHTEPCYDETLYFSRLPLLEAVLRGTPQVEIVITSSWRERRSLQHLQDFFCRKIADRIIGVTPTSSDHPGLSDLMGPSYIRSIEIEAWLRASHCPWSEWVALDDKRFLFRPFTRNLIWCDPVTGLSNENIDDLRSRLE